ncbi:uncharacterized protein LOC119102367 [Pollicipes pollicipes]|uniref:uncharacterized protein LOC119102367 n=1 Tax=Pollicipes pollicipes TaxID=41117 RepID=UPI001885611C|nr:uncharacterized protein LOC119102367 [Pollicipes pollicipes]
MTRHVLTLLLCLTGAWADTCGPSGLVCGQICESAGANSSCSCVPGWALAADKQTCAVSKKALCYKVETNFFDEHPAKADFNETVRGCEKSCKEKKAHYSAQGRLGCRCLDFFEVVASLDVLTLQPKRACDRLRESSWRT